MPNKNGHWRRNSSGSSYRTRRYPVGDEDGRPPRRLAEVRSHRMHGDTAPADKLSGEIDLEALAWSAEVEGAERRATGGMSIGRLILEGGFTDQVAKLARRMRRQEVGAVALVPLGVLYTNPTSDPNMVIGQAFRNDASGVDWQIEELLNVNLSLPRQWRLGSTVWVGMHLSHEDLAVVEYIKDECSASQDAHPNLDRFQSHGMRVPLFGFPPSSVNDISQATIDLSRFNRMVELGSVSAIANGMIALNPGENGPAS